MHFRALKVINTSLFCLYVNAVVYRVFRALDCDASYTHHFVLLVRLHFVSGHTGAFTNLAKSVR